MENRRVLVVAVALVTVVASVGVPIVGAVAGQVTETPPEPETAPMGTQLSAFMQHSAAQANDSVDDGMWEAAFDRANESERARLATERADDLGGRVADLEDERDRLEERREDGDISGADYAARASEVNGRIEAFRSAVNGTARAAERAGVDAAGLETLKQNASQLAGPELAGVARGLAGGNRGPPTDGPPTDAGPSTDAGPPTDPGASGDGNGPQGPEPGNGTGVPPGGNGPGGGDGPPGGPPDGGDGGNEQGGSDGNQGNGQGPGEGSGPGQGNGPGDGDGPGRGNGPGQG